jgi:4-diphosphocytidyl-2-C-methyl-D-erythritol kinase
MRWVYAPAKVNLTLRILGVRPDGYHELESLVAFAGLGDWLGFAPGPQLALDVEGANADNAGPLDKNLVLRAARALQERVPGLTLGRFRLVKRLPTAAGLGGGSADAAAALRCLAEANNLGLDDPRLMGAAITTGADVPVCLESRARVMMGVGDALGPHLHLPPLFTVLANPRVSAPTGAVFKAHDEGANPLTARDSLGASGPITIEALAASGNDLEAAARSVAPAIGDVLTELSRLDGARVTRMSGSGATCFALFDDPNAAASGALRIRSIQPAWWAEATALR